MTSVAPTGNKSPDAWDWMTVGGTPESSMAVGSIQVTAAVDVPDGTSTGSGGVGQLVITGIVLSTATTIGRWGR